MNLVGLIAKNTIQKEWRSKTLLFLLVTTVLIVLLASVGLSYVKNNVLTDSPLEGLAQTTLGVFFWGINFWSFLVATFVGVSTVRSDFESGVISQMLTFPLSRKDYLLGRLMGSYAIVTGYYIISMLICVFSISWAVGEFLLSPSLLLGVFIISLSNLVAITTAMIIAFKFGTIQSFILNVLLTFSIGFANNFYGEKGFIEGLKPFGFIKAVGALIHLFIPHTALWDGWGNSFILSQSSKFKVGIEIPHFMITYFMILLVGLFIFRRREN